MQHPNLDLKIIDVNENKELADHMFGPQPDHSLAVRRSLTLNLRMCKTRCIV